jgi:hypothetical protein
VRGRRGWLGGVRQQRYDFTELLEFFAALRRFGQGLIDEGHLVKIQCAEGVGGKLSGDLFFFSIHRACRDLAVVETDPLMLQNAFQFLERKADPGLHGAQGTAKLIRNFAL